GIDVIATNISQQGCDITIKPGVSLRGGGARLPVDSVVTEEAKIGPTYLAPGKDAITQVFWGPHYCGPRPASYDVVLTWGDSEEHSVNVRDAVYPTCGDGGGNLSPGWFEVAQPSAMPVLPKIEPPLTVKRGETLHFRVSLVGTQQEPYVLDPCPAYAMALYPAEPNTAVSSADEHAFRLNCAAAPKQIDPGEAVTFEMQLDVPASMLLGRATLSWRMGYRGVDAKTEITVT
ncbi:MAG: hypothetical protein QOI64_706, partial [Solirubrobacteraceae bacterium]|nr:hypothetical protein [Solirubrobacteraceae bacterium]